jgi:hypothetical protein
MRFYEVFVRLVNHGKEIGKTCVQLKANSPFMAALEAEKAIDGRYGESVVSHTIRVDSISEDEFLHLLAA